MSAMREHKIICILTRLVLCFAVSSLIGWIYEVIVGYLVWGEYADRGILRLPLCPIYGFGALLLAAIFREKKSAIAVFVYGTAASTLLELGISYLVEWIFHFRLWSYQEWPLHFQGRISLISSLIFGIFSVFIVKILWPLLRRIVSATPLVVGILLDLILLTAILADAALSITPLIRYRWSMGICVLG